MAINKKLIHFKNFSDFNSKKLSANENNTQYTLGINGAVTNGSPDILYQSICYIKDTQQQWTHGQLYECSKTDTTFNETDPLFSASPAATITEKDITAWNGAVQPKDISDFITIEDVAAVATSGSYNSLADVPWQYIEDCLYSDRSVEVDGALSTYEALYTPALYTSTLHDKDDNCGSKGQVLAVDDNGQIIWEDNVTESTVSDWGFTKNTGTYSKPSTGIPVSDLAGDIQTSLGKANTALQSYTEQYKGTITGVSANGTSIATSGIANIPAASTSVYGVTKLSSSTSSTSTTLAATPSAVKAAYDLANGRQEKLVSGTNIKTINGTSILGSGDITISGGSSDANVKAVDTGDVIDDVNVNYATTTYVDGLIGDINSTLGDINSVLESIINGGSGVSLITFKIDDTEYQAENGMTWEEWINSEYNINEFYILNNEHIIYGSNIIVEAGASVRSSDVIKNINYYTSYDPSILGPT